uniref:NADH-ubiquinone oxidoreductase chain 1 n=1 Tax=Yuukianura szeptyckii TaxID=1453868 RepID=A0A7T0Q520_9HEXA|nr:NADH dehydrogenase subunit 1 [Yuukianura szeptyckii]QPL15832.1 NADH dehydrogenase subunit 1 [Yuukianura szeptyckii]
MISYVFLMTSYLIMVIGVLICVAFIVLLERKLLGYIQIRKGPNKVGVMGILQPFSDAIKLFSKEQFLVSLSSLYMYYWAPALTFFIILTMWATMPTGSNYISLELGSVLFFCCSSFSVYGLLGSGWSSNSSYAMLGAMRGVAQTISYEVSFMLFFLAMVCMLSGLDFFNYTKNQFGLLSGLTMLPLLMIWLSLSMAETNRTPFDFAEGESELVSGFNIEYGSGGFALIFLAEYASIIFMSYLIVLVFMGAMENAMLFNLLGVEMCFMFVWVRGTMPRLRYDKLMEVAWKSYLPLSLCYFLLMYGVKVMVNV